MLAFSVGIRITKPIFRVGVALSCIRNNPNGGKCSAKTPDRIRSFILLATQGTFSC
jgi:hypothetical protein